MAVFPNQLRFTQLQSKETTTTVFTVTYNDMCISPKGIVILVVIVLWFGARLCHIIRMRELISEDYLSIPT